MKTISILLIISLFSCKDNSKTTRQQIMPEKESSTDSITTAITSLEDIKKNYAFVNSRLKDMDTLGFSYNCQGEKGGHVMYYSDSEGIKVIKHSYNQYSHFSAENTYFINDGKPYFILYDETSWMFDGGSGDTPKTKDDITEKRFYIIEDTLTQCLEKKYTIRSESTNNPKPEEIPNQTMACPSIDEIHNQFELLYKYKSNSKSLECLE